MGFVGGLFIGMMLGVNFGFVVVAILYASDRQ